MHLNEYGDIVSDEWIKSFDIRDELLPDEFIIMPNHLHAIIHLTVETPGGRLRDHVNGRSGQETPGGCLKNHVNGHSVLEIPGGCHPVCNTEIPVQGSRISIRDPHKPVQNPHSSWIDESPGYMNETPGRASLRDESLTGQDMGGLRPASLSSFMAGVKSAITKRINTVRQTPGKRIFQPRFYDRIVRNEQELYRIRQYIKNNPAKWKQDKLKL